MPYIHISLRRSFAANRAWKTKHKKIPLSNNRARLADALPPQFLSQIIISSRKEIKVTSWPKRALLSYSQSILLMKNLERN